MITLDVETHSASEVQMYLDLLKMIKSGTHRYQAHLRFDPAKAGEFYPNG